MLVKVETNATPDFLEIEENLTTLAVLGEVIYHLAGCPTRVSATTWCHIGNEIEHRAKRVFQLVDSLPREAR
jgi:hypothetical protein